TTRAGPVAESVICSFVCSRGRELLGGLALGGLFLGGLGGRSGDHVDDQQLGVAGQAHALGQRERARGDLGAGLDALDGDLDRLGQVQRVGLDGDGGGLLGDQGAGGGVAGDGDRDVGDDFLTALDDQQVGVLDVAADRV